MRIAGRDLGLPLLAKELIEQAARRRTYVVRTIYAVLFFFIAGLQLISLSGFISRDPLQVLGQGRQVFSFLVGLQFAGIYLFMPAITCGVLTAEKERNSLGLLFLTRLGPWTILFEKLAGRLLTMFSFLLLSVPMLAFAYAMGGVSPESLWLAVWYLGLSVLQVGALALACSAYFRTTPSALIGCYVLGMAMFFGPPLLQAFELVRFDFLVDTIAMLFGFPDLIIGDRPSVSMYLFGPYVFFVAEYLAMVQALAVGIPIVGTIFVWLGLARFFVVRRAFAQRQPSLNSLWRKVDRLFPNSDKDRPPAAAARGTTHTLLPDDEPVAWRETTKKPIGSWRYLVFILAAVELPLLGMCFLSTGLDYPLLMLSMLLILLWIIAALVVTVTSANLIAGERARQTLDLLLTTPMSGRELVEQKFRGVMQLIAVLAVPFMTLFLVQTAWREDLVHVGPSSTHNSFADAGGAALYLVCSILTVCVYLPLAAWMSMLIGLKVHSQNKAIVGSLAAVLLWGAFPFMAAMPCVIVVDAFGTVPIDADARETIFFVFLLSPTWMIPVNEYGVWDELEIDAPLLQVVLHFALQGGLLLAIHRYCLNAADRLLGRE